MLKQLFTWWNGHTFGALYDIRRRSRFVGEDEQGNRYFEDRKRSVSNRNRRYVIYNGLAEASKVPAEWQGWLRYVYDEPPSEVPLKRQRFEIDHKPNLTGTPMAYRPKGAMSAADSADPAFDPDYEAWTPDA